MTPPAPLWHWGEPTAPLAQLLARGGVLAIPTESSYGLAADPRNPKGVAAVYRLKGREADQALPVVVADAGQLAGLGLDLAAPGYAVALEHWPAALSVLLPLARPLAAAAGKDELAVRVPAHARLRGLLGELGPLTATSANRSGQAPLLAAADVASWLAGEPVMVVDDGRLAGGAPSTLVRFAVDGFEVLRAGAYPQAALVGRTTRQEARDDP